FCDPGHIPESQSAPCSADLLNAWIATMSGNYAGTFVKNYVHSLRAWHMIHCVEWIIDKTSFNTIVQGAEDLQID
ncbi:hypothetical protein F5051DRAFT_338258, partial [Lentinula edodes]